jgi:acetylornithine deacetylase
MTRHALEIAQRLIGFDTTVEGPGHAPIAERACQEYVAGLLQSAGFEVDLWEPSVDELRDHPLYREGQHYRDRPIVVGRLPGAGGGRSLMFNGHIDTVPAGDVARWTTDPWIPTIRDGRLYGRGACDMKGGVAAMLDAALTIAAGPPLAGDLLVEVVTDEEINGMGTLAAIRRGHRADAAVVPEPTGLDIWIAFRGILVAELEVRGRKGHVEVAQPHWSQGGAVNAVHHMLGVLSWLRELNAEWADRPDKQHPLCSVGELHVTTIAGGDFYANVPESCRATLDICYVPGEEDADGYGGKVKAEIEEHLARLERGWLAEEPPRLSWLVDFPPAELSSGEAIVRELAGSVAASLGRRPRILGLDTWDDTVSLIREANMPSVSFGPGSNDQAHAVDEFVSVEQLEACARAMGSFASEWCGRPRTAAAATRADVEAA